MTYDRNKHTYVARLPDAHGIIHYTDEEHAVWHDLFTRQLPIAKTHACAEFLTGLNILDFSSNYIPQCHEISAKLYAATGWSVTRVNAIISAEQFFCLLANRQFPAATFIRRREEIDYLEEPDIFHEFFGHCPLLTDPIYANFMYEYGKLGLQANESVKVLLARLYWFTVEFGLIETPQGIKAYGGGILSSFQETQYSVNSPIPQRKNFDALEALRTPYRIDIMQPIYFVIKNYDQLYNISQNELLNLIAKAQELGDYAPAFVPVS